MKKKNSTYVFPAIGVVLLAGGLFFIKTLEDPQGVLQALPYLCFGLGCGIFSHGMGELIIRFATKNNPSAAKQIEIDKKDERNLAIANRAKAKAYDMLVFMFLPLIIAFSLMDVDKKILWLLVSAYLFILAYNAYYRVKYFKEM